MGIRGIDIQVAIQRAAEAEKIQQGETSQVRAGEAGTREEGELERLRRQQQPQKTESGGQVVIQDQKEQEQQERNEEQDEEQNEEFISSEEEEIQVLRKRLKSRGRLDILA